MNRLLPFFAFVLLVLIALSEARGRGGRRGRLGHRFSRVHGWGRRGSGSKHHSGRCPMRLVCQVTGPEESDVKFKVHSCSKGSECNVGPMNVNGTGELQGKSFGVKFCDTVDSKGNLKVLSGACSILLSNGTVARNETEPTERRRGFFRRFMRKKHDKSQKPCSVGPLTGNVTFGGEEAEAFFRMPLNLGKLIVKESKDIKTRLRSFHEKILDFDSWKKLFGA
ncbi:hypothetical protein CAPTEDRAFT_185819 [Capitella teleta]|uniref:Uncharacterized protein n=1 Tax=Capitella teleta TaxID=283909 RepID=R7UKF2_CAPTE|nr:hypothetical protein CAPTEDRAFT_185819 [Capitella teleta]|eukprot:ELU06543.1 hypothetical protein CAPTEDRAFT_185819 [Capitella teleta]